MGFIVVAVVGAGMVSFSASLNDNQYRYLLKTKAEDQSKSDRLRELVDKGIKVENEQ